jgi:callose synthase
MPKIEENMIWEPMQIIAHTYDYGMGVLLFVPLAVLAMIPIIPATQTRLLFHKAFSRKPQILSFIRALAKIKRR